MIEALFAAGLFMCPWRAALAIGITISIVYSLAWALAVVAALGWIYFLVRSYQYA